MSKKSPIVFKIGEGKYIIDIATSLNQDKREIRRKVRTLNRDDKKESTENK